jgi:WD40 repeat protein
VLQVSTHGCIEGQILIWKHTRMTQLATLASHSSGVYYIAASPDWEAIATGGEYETHLWHLFSKAHSHKVSAQFIQWQNYVLMDNIYTCRNYKKGL